MWAVKQQKNRRIRAAVVAILLLMGWDSAASRPFAVDDDDAFKQDQSTESLPSAPDSKQDFKSMEVVKNDKECKGLSTLGSRPPNCEHKCGRCNPCEAIQVPTTTDHLGVQYTNYEPEGWKCKCGASFFNP